MLPRKSYITSLHTGSVADLWIALSICKTRGGDNGIAVHCSLSMQRFISFCEQYGHVLAAVILTNVSLFTHLRVFRMYGPHPFGYDTGFYRRYLLEPFISFPNAPVPGLGDDALVPRMLLDVLRFVHLSPDVILYGSYVAFFVRSEEHTSELQSQFHLVCRLLLEKNRTYDFRRCVFASVVDVLTVLLHVPMQ